MSASYCVHLEIGNRLVGGGAPNPMGADLLNYRKKVSGHFTDFKEIITSSSFKRLFSSGITSQSGIVKKRVPGDFEVEDPAAEFLKKDEFVTREVLPEHDLMTEEGLKKTLSS